MTGTDAPGEQRQLHEFLEAERNRCRAISERNSRRCQHDALTGVDYCAHHYHLFDKPREENRL